jgi:hypothetical protein
MGGSVNEALRDLLNVVRVAAGFFVVMAGWIGIQAFARRRSGCARDRDMLDYMLHGCGSCLNSGKCTKSEERTRTVMDRERERHEPL